MNDELKELATQTLEKYSKLEHVNEVGETKSLYTTVFRFQEQKFIIPHDHLFYEKADDALTPDLCASITLYMMMEEVDIAGSLEIDVQTILIEGEVKQIPKGKIGFGRKLPIIGPVVIIAGSEYDDAREAGEEMAFT